MNLRILAGAAALTMALLPRLAHPCGGLFCQTQGQPVEQNAERILFEVNADGTISAHVEITYAGAPEGFSWVVPVPDTPVLDVVPPSTLRLLDLATAPRIISPPTRCTDPFGNIIPLGGMAMADSAGEVAPGGVTVEDLPSVGPFDPQVISSDSAAPLITWLKDNGYLITPEMEPFIAGYVTRGFKFLGMKLTPGAATADIQPIKMTYTSDEPCVPLELTAVGAEPEMGVVVIIAAPTRYGAKNYENLLVATDQVHMHPATRQSNYYELVSRLIDDAGGNAFVTEMASPALQVDPTTVFLATDDQMEATEYVQEVVTRNAYVTRLYSRLSAWEMGSDPVFHPAAGPDVSRTHDLSDRAPVEVCGDTPDPVPCGSTYCGPGSMCATTKEGIDGCVCKPGTVARGITAPNLLLGPVPAVTCQLAAFDLLASVGPAVACQGFSCGEGGRCVAVGGFPACECDEGFAAVPLPGKVSCAKVKKTFGPEQLEWSGCGGCAGASGSAGLLALLLVAALGVRRRP